AVVWIIGAAGYCSAHRSIHCIAHPLRHECQSVRIRPHALGLGVGCEELGRPLRRISADLAAELRAGHGLVGHLFRSIASRFDNNSSAWSRAILRAWGLN